MEQGQPQQKQERNSMNKTHFLTGALGFVLCLALTAGLTGCVGVAGPGYDEGPDYVDGYVPGPDLYVFGGYGRDHFDHDRDFARRGAESRHFTGAGHNMGGFRGFSGVGRGGGGGGGHVGGVRRRHR